MRQRRSRARGQDYPRPRPADLTSSVRFLWWLVVAQRGRATLGALLGIAWMVGLTVTPYVLSRAIDSGLRTGHYPSLLRWVALLLAVGLLNAAVSICRHRTMTRVRMDGAFRTVSAVVATCAEAGAGLSRKVTAGEVATIGIGDVWTISTSLTVVGPGVGSAVGFVVVAVLLLAISPLLAVVAVLGVPAVVLLVGPVLGRLLQVGTSYRARQGSLSNSLVDLVEGLRVLNGIGGKESHEDRFRQESSALQQEGYRVGSVASWVPALGVGLPMVFLAAVTWLAARMALAGTISIGQLVAVYGYVAVLVVPVQELIWSGSALSQSVVSARRVLALLRLTQTPTDQTPSDQTPSNQTQTGQTQTDQTPTAQATAGQPPIGPADLHDPISGVTVQPGLLTVLAGARPAEQQALVDRLGGYETAAPAPDGSRVAADVVRTTGATWGEVPLAELPVRRVRERILVAEHESHLFAGSLRSVVSGRATPDDTAVAGALHSAAAEDVVDGLPGGLAGTVDEGGRNLSGGQRQRVRLARALLADPEVLLAVEPTSAVDAHTEALIADRLRTARAGRTTVLASTSPPLLDQADVVHYLVDGRLMDSGTHAELLARQPDYRRLVSRDLDDPEASDPDPTRGRATPTGRRP